MLGHIEGIVLNSLDLFNRMSPYLVFGFFFAGLLHIFISIETIANHLGKNSAGSILKSIVLGIPLPLCSCGVIPAAIALDKKGAGKGAVVSFLISTPITGIDSIFATYSLMGLFFAIFRVVSSCLTAVIAGILTNFTHPKTGVGGDLEGLHHHHETCAVCEEHHCCQENPVRHRFAEKLGALFRYAFVELVGDIWKWLMIGILIAGIIEYAIPDAFIQKSLGNSWTAMPLMLLIGIPMYVCATGSIPIAASLMLKGMSPGAALVFLLAGPATNAVTITVVSKEIGKTATVLYVATIAVMSIVMGTVLNYFWYRLDLVAPDLLRPMETMPGWVNIASSVLFGALIIISLFKTVINSSKKKHRHD